MLMKNTELYWWKIGKMLRQKMSQSYFEVYGNLEIDSPCASDMY